MINKKYTFTLLTLFLLRLLFVIYSTNFENMIFTKDSYHYIEISKNISQSYLSQNTENYWIDTFRLPGYPLIINFFSQFINTKYIIYTNFLFDSLSCLLIYKIIHDVKKDEFLSFLGVLLFLINPNILISSTQIMTENISMLLLLLTVFFSKNDRTINVVLAGIFLGLFSLVKPFGIYILLFFIITKLFIFKIKIKKIAIFAAIPISIISIIHINNAQNYGIGFYSTSSYFHMQWFNDASSSLCDDFNFDNERVSEPGYRFDEWKLENNFNDKTNPKVFIESLKQDAQSGIFQNIKCKVLSVVRSTIWNLFGIRQSNWSNSFIENPYLNVIKLFSAFYVLLININFVFSIKLIKYKTQIFYILLVLFYLSMISLLPYGNARTRVLIEPYLIIIFIYNIKYLIENIFKKT